MSDSGVHYLCPKGKRPSGFRACDVKGAVETGMRLKCNACLFSCPADDYLEVKETPKADE